MVVTRSDRPCRPQNRWTSSARGAAADEDGNVGVTELGEGASCVGEGSTVVDHCVFVGFELVGDASARGWPGAMVSSWVAKSSPAVAR